jgi:hypothetical protein
MFDAYYLPPVNFAFRATRVAQKGFEVSKNLALTNSL